MLNLVEFGGHNTYFLNKVQYAPRINELRARGTLSNSRILFSPFSFLIPAENAPKQTQDLVLKFP